MSRQKSCTRLDQKTKVLDENLYLNLKFSDISFLECEVYLMARNRSDHFPQEGDVEHIQA
jgi:hypothetical protein